MTRMKERGWRMDVRMPLIAILDLPSSIFSEAIPSATEMRRDRD